jgi:GNAT superfamily N-acetyltransferase
MPDARRRGVGAALTVTALRVAPDKPATVIATAAGLPVYRRLGFLGIGRRRNWHPPSSGHDGGGTTG